MKEPPDQVGGSFRNPVGGARRVASERRIAAADAALAYP